ncbi:hypothetical protein BS47DRAFT_952968 [Hydnum rufescens UP504]|uniref:Uncharacterized protein n=1 Tax=Hydnum rufescens UP504 TaxID=1448309 RepID=A0A9P6AX95_9AGAM|nr:hypothetical protein BS47DRAFT_952968 [Hydnum rufescens UP504]
MARFIGIPTFLLGGPAAMWTAVLLAAIIAHNLRIDIPASSVGPGHLLRNGSEISPPCSSSFLILACGCIASNLSAILGLFVLDGTISSLPG